MGETDRGPPVVVCDAGPRIHMDELVPLDLLADFPAVLVPDDVRREVRRHRPKMSSLHLKRSLLDDVVRKAEELP